MAGRLSPANAKFQAPGGICTARTLRARHRCSALSPVPQQVGSSGRGASVCSKLQWRSPRGSSMAVR
eukprot:1190926-Prymnesium_polylepis.1